MTVTGRVRSAQACACAALLVLPALTNVAAQTDDVAIRNSFTPGEEVRLGREAAAVVRRLLPLLKGRGVDDFVKDIGGRLVGGIAPELRQSRFRYSFEVVNVTDLVSYALPGGPIFVSRGMIEAAPNEAALAGLLAHQLSHVVLRHGTLQTTRGETFELGDIAGQTLGAIELQTEDEPTLPGSNFGVSTYFLKYDATLEREADGLGAQILARAGYDPRQTAEMFRTIARTGPDRGGQAWVESHPASTDSNQDPDVVGGVGRTTDRVPPARSAPPGRFDAIRARLRLMAPAPTADEAARASRLAEGPVGPTGVEVPSGESRRVSVGNVLQMSVPTNWRRLSGGSAVMFAPSGAGFETQGGLTAFTHGVQVGVVRSPTQDLARDMQAVLQRFGQTNPRLQWAPVYQRASLGGRRGMLTVASNVSAVTERFEYVSVAAAHLRDGSLLYVIGLAPQLEAGTYRGAFTRVRQSIQLIDD